MGEVIFDSYDYKKVVVQEEFLSQYIDGYKSLGWNIDENVKKDKVMGKVTLHLKRSRNILNKVELTRLQRHYEACMEEICTLENSKSTVPTMVSISFGIIGCAFMAGSVFAFTGATQIIWLMIVLAIPGFLCWAATYFSYNIVKKRRSRKVEPLIEAKYDEIYEISKKGQSLL